MEKALTFSKKQKSLVWQRFVQPNGGTEEEAKHFIEVCETFGLNPLLGDVVFQRYETRQGPRTNFITTRDGLLRIASQQKDYVGAPVSNVVREGDEFEFIPSEGNVKHKFGKKRGKILGAYAILKHRRFHPVSVFVDFDEYFKANARSQGGKSPIWDTMPSAMIQKVAEVFVLRRQFPLGGLYTAEEMGLDDVEDGGGGNEVAQLKQPSQPSQDVTPQLEEERKEQRKKVEVEDEKPIETSAPDASKAGDEQQKVSEKKETHSTNESSSAEHPGQYVLVERDSGTSPSGVPFAKMKVQSNGEELLVLAKGEEGVRLAESIPQDQPFHMEVHEKNGFKFLESVNGQTVEQGAA